MDIDKMFADARVRVHESIDAHAARQDFNARSAGQRARRLRERMQQESLLNGR